jgi:hypothetical protein
MIAEKVVEPTRVAGSQLRVWLRPNAKLCPLGEGSAIVGSGRWQTLPRDRVQSVCSPEGLGTHEEASFRYTSSPSLVEPRRFGLPDFAVKSVP